MAKSFHISVVTPEGTVYDGPTEFVVVPACDGELGILRDRAALLAQLGAGRLRISSGTDDRTWFVDGGFVQVLDNKATVLTQRAIAREQIDPGRARTNLEEARRLPAHDEAEFESRAAAEASARAQLRLAR